jgi:L-ascorbate metabolism protein UlaG (beta-lactamase superfamily)
MLRSLLAAVLSAAALAALPGAPALASQCLAFVEQAPPDWDVRAVPAALEGARAGDTVRIRFVGHATFRIETPGGVAIATDYTGRAGPGPVPTVVTMNKAHSTHYTDNPDPRIAHVLRGWNPEGGPAKHDLQVGDARIRNVPTDIRSSRGAAEKHGNSIFIFEVADLCIGHLGHLHHRLSDADIALIGRLDVVMAPVDGSYTLDLPNMIATLKELRSSLVIPMHFFGGRSLERFLVGMSGDFAVRQAEHEVIEVSLRTLPRQPTVMVPKLRWRGAP